jgi:hypothetical protein
MAALSILCIFSFNTSQNALALAGKNAKPIAVVSDIAVRSNITGRHGLTSVATARLDG